MCYLKTTHVRYIEISTMGKSRGVMGYVHIQKRHYVHDKQKIKDCCNVLKMLD